MRTLLVPLLLLTLTATGCAGQVIADDDVPTAAPADPEPTTPEPPGPDDEPVAEPVTDPEPVAEPVTDPEPVTALSDGEHVGFLVGVTTDPATVTIDPVTWVADDSAPNGYRIEDPGLDPVDLHVADGATLEVLRSTGDPTTAETVSADELRAWFADLGQAAGDAMFDVVVADGEVTALQFRYRP